MNGCGPMNVGGQTKAIVPSFGIVVVVIISVCALVVDGRGMRRNPWNVGACHEGS